MSYPGYSSIFKNDVVHGCHIPSLSVLDFELKNHLRILLKTAINLSFLLQFNLSLSRIEEAYESENLSMSDNVHGR